MSALMGASFPYWGVTGRLFCGGGSDWWVLYTCTHTYGCVFCVCLRVFVHVHTRVCPYTPPSHTLFLTHVHSHAPTSTYTEPPHTHTYTIHRRVRVFRFATGKLRRTYDESLEAVSALQQSQSPTFTYVCACVCVCLYHSSCGGGYSVCCVSVCMGSMHLVHVVVYMLTITHTTTHYNTLQHTTTHALTFSQVGQHRLW